MILAGGASTRMGGESNKVLRKVGGRHAVSRSVEAFRPFADSIVLVRREQDAAALAEALAEDGLDPASLRYAPGGETRQDSVWNGLQAVPADCDRVLIHDGARCLVDAETIARCMAGVDRDGTGVAAIPVTDTIKEADAEGRVIGTPDRSRLRAVQTPQGFRLSLLRQAHEAARAEGWTGTDDASLVERLGVPVRLTEGNRRNLKLTTPEDLIMAEGILGTPALRIGQGYDVHAFAPDRPLVLCGVTVPHDRGLLGHSDADVAVHALMDALLGALALGDIGQHFPDTDPRYAGISSMALLAHVMDLLKARGAAPVNADVTIVAQRPKLAAYIPDMRRNLARAMEIGEDRVSVKATTTERLGFEGRCEGISAQAVCLLSLR